MFSWIVVSIAAVVLAGGLVAFWSHVADFVQRSLLPWCRDIHPLLEGIVRNVFQAVDQVATPLSRSIRDGWRRLKRWIAGQLVYYERRSHNCYIQKIVTYFRQTLATGERKLFEQTERREIDPLDIPAEFRDRVIGMEASRINMTEHVEQAIQHLNA